MNRLKDIFNKRLDYIKKAVVNDNNRKKLMFTGLNIVLFFVCLTMSVVNVFTKEYTLMYSTIVFGSVCLINFLLMFTKMNKSILYICFTLEAFALLCFYFITGIPEGFSALWVCLIPSFALLFFGGKKRIPFLPWRTHRHDRFILDPLGTVAFPLSIHEIIPAPFSFSLCSHLPSLPLCGIHP